MSSESGVVESASGAGGPADARWPGTVVPAVRVADDASASTGTEQGEEAA